MKVEPEWGCVMESKYCKPSSGPPTPGRCSITTACSKHWKQQFCRNPREHAREEEKNQVRRR